ncbi:hypothetical protein ACNBFH_004442 [Salmonella enterica subsp. enterica serovar Bareilly]
MKNLSARIDDHLAELLNRHCHSSGQTQTQVIIAALRAFLGSPDAAPIQHVIDTQMMIAQRLEAIEGLLKPSAKSAVSRDAAPRRETPLTAPVSDGDGSYQPDKLYALLSDWKGEREAKGQSACWGAWASACNDAGLRNKKLGTWSGDTLGHWFKRQHRARHG